MIRRIRKPASSHVAIDAECVDAIDKPRRMMAPMQWYGGKGRMAKRIVSLLPAGRIYVEPFCGAASVFWHLPAPYPVEVLNDLDGRVVNLFRVLQDPDTFAQLHHRITWTLYSLDEFRRALQILAAPDEHSGVTRAWALFVVQNQGFSGVTAQTEGVWSRALISYRGMAATANKWRGRMRMFAHWHDRLTRVQLDARDALEVIRYWDHPDTVFYIDPPYVHDTRVANHRQVYAHEPDDVFHARMVELLLAIRGQAVLSGYDTPLYAPLTEAGWVRHIRETRCFAANRGRGSKLRDKGAARKHAARTEVMWCTPTRCAAKTKSTAP